MVSFTVTVHDTTAPQLTVPADITAQAGSPAGLLVSFVASATDTVTAAPVVTCGPASGTTFPIGVTTVECSALDAAGNSASGMFLGDHHPGSPGPDARRRHHGQRRHPCGVPPGHPGVGQLRRHWLARAEDRSHDFSAGVSDVFFSGATWPSPAQAPGTATLETFTGPWRPTAVSPAAATTRSWSWSRHRTEPLSHQSAEYLASGNNQSLK